MLSRRCFLLGSAACSAGLLCAQSLPPAPTTRPDIASIDHDRILAGASRALGRMPRPSGQSPASETQGPAFLAFTLDVPALAAAILIDPANTRKYADHAAALLDAWLLDPATRLPSTPAFAIFEPVSDLSSLAEIAVALPFLALEATLAASLSRWFKQYLDWLTTDRTALLARDSRNHAASAWLLQCAAIARLTDDDRTLADVRHRFHSVTLRAQMDPNGFFPHELNSPNPLRDSLFNLDLLAGACVLLSTRFDDPWSYELPEGPGMRAAIARFVPYIRRPATWPYPADETFFHALPFRRPALVFAGRAYGQADYITLWRTLDPDPREPELLRTFPIRQPLLWMSGRKAFS